MATFTILIEGELPEGDDIRELFETLIRQIRLDGRVKGELTLDDVPYSADDVADEGSGADAGEEGEEDEPAQEGGPGQSEEETPGRLPSRRPEQEPDEIPEMTYFFGEPWPSDICDDGQQVDTPIGTACLLCREVVVAGDRGEFMYSVEDGRAQQMPVHRECALRNVLGGIEHLTFGPHAVGECYEGSTLSYRDSSLAAWDWVQRNGVEAAIN